MSNEKKIILWSSIAHFLSHFHELIFPALVIPLTLSMKMELAEIIKLSFFLYLLMGIGALPWGVIVDRFNNRFTLIVFFIGSGASACLTALSHSGISLTISLAMIGLFVSSYHPAGMGLISLGVRNRGRALGINGIAGSIGMASAPFAAGLLNWLFGWQAVYLLIGVMSLTLGGILLAVPIDETPVRKQDVESAAEEANWNIGQFALLCMIMTLGGLAYRMNSLVLPACLEIKATFIWQYLERLSLPNIAGTATMAATLLVTFVYLIGILGQWLGGLAADRHDLRWLYLIFHSLSLPFLIYMGSASGIWLVGSAAVYVFFALGMQPAENSLVAWFNPERWRSTGYGIKFILFFGIGSTAVYVTAWIQKHWGISAVFFFSGGMVAMMLAGIGWLIWLSRGEICRN
jgi:predicted MFS family arabinose efflux permease